MSPVANEEKLGSLTVTGFVIKINFSFTGDLL